MADLDSLRACDFGSRAVLDGISRGCWSAKWLEMRESRLEGEEMEGVLRGIPEAAPSSLSRWGV